ncbi:thioredoxin family protein [Hymenobacter sp. BT523]|uniref:thioredoxin family protein n=1 Tax=Hymenobacter sp. BT523 TaxID=2795725 RepID=UPI0018EB26DE|nr:thioredoxin family protein [Hymenobacter sp. BT523]MBJ6109314.1 thioredoxin family protein [Hymenobacter sp. BT523]
MFEFLRSTVVDTDDEGLRRITHERMKVFAKFTAEDCLTCKLLGPGFAKFADDEEYQGILFVRLASDENPVAKQLMNQRAAPFFVSYCQGRILECDTRETDADVRAQLNRLRAFMPHTA